MPRTPLRKVGPSGMAYLLAVYYLAYRWHHCSHPPYSEWVGMDSECEREERTQDSSRRVEKKNKLLCVKTCMKEKRRLEEEDCTVVASRD